MKELHHIFSELSGNLYKHFIFFIPTNFKLDPENITPDIEALLPVLNRLVYVNEDRKIEFPQGNSLLAAMAEKSSLLDKNLFLLMDARENQPEVTFDYLFNRYLSSLYFYVYVSSWMAENIEIFRESLPENTAHYFEIQQNNYAGHLNTFIVHFKIYPDEYNDFKKHWVDINRDLLPLIKDTVGSDFRSHLTHQNVISSPPPVLNDQEAKKFLLQSVFNVKGL